MRNTIQLLFLVERRVLKRNQEFGSNPPQPACILMNVSELKEILDDYPGEMEVKLAQQPHWSFQYSIGNVVEASTIDEDEDQPGVDELSGEKGETCIFIGEGGQDKYLSSDAASKLGWKS